MINNVAIANDNSDNSLCALIVILQTILAMSDKTRRCTPILCSIPIAVGGDDGVYRAQRKCHRGGSVSHVRDVGTDSLDHVNTVGISSFAVDIPFFCGSWMSDVLARPDRFGSFRVESTLPSRNWVVGIPVPDTNWYRT